MVNDRVNTAPLSVISNLGEDIWHGLEDPGAYEWWHFDAMSDDGREAVAIVFSDNYIYAPRVPPFWDTWGAIAGKRFPAVSFAYFLDGRLVYRSIRDHINCDFVAETDRPGCRVGDSSFSFDSAAYGSGYFVSMVVPLAGGRTLKAQLEWLSIESDLSLASEEGAITARVWNVVVPRSDVSGRIDVEDRRGRRLATHHFRGTGYHDHQIDRRGREGISGEWYWGRAHYYDSTLVFGRLRASENDDGDSNLIVVRDGVIRLRRAATLETEFSRDILGIRYPARFRLTTDEGLQVKSKTIKTIQSGFYFLRFINEITLMLRDGIPRKTLGIAEFYPPRARSSRWFDLLKKLGRRKKRA
ncbi:MAG TPA: hypothetical protein PKD24_09275 [Pyrinomonadaceae bacterium]|nr:hypothetical protein [Pyrinomonadaceae bacterium]HMP65741.1 hypothetical protein [Pyrinomonadaceae bacterium]